MKRHGVGLGSSDLFIVISHHHNEEPLSLLRVTTRSILRIYCYFKIYQQQLISIFYLGKTPQKMLASLLPWSPPFSRA